MNSPIHWAARNGHVDCIIELLKCNPVLNQQVIYIDIYILFIYLLFIYLFYLF